MYQNLCAMLYAKSMQLPANGPFLPHKPNWRGITKQENSMEDIKLAATTTIIVVVIVVVEARREMSV